MGGIAQNTGSTMGGGLPSNPMGSRFGRNLNMPQGMPQKPMFRGMGLPPAQPQGMPMQGSPFGNMKPYVSPMGQQPQVSPMQSQLTPDMLNNMKMKLQAQAQQGMTQNPNFLGTVVNQMQGQPTQGGLFGNMGAYVSPMAQRPQGSPQNTNQMQQAQSMNQMAGLMQNTPQY